MGMNIYMPLEPKKPLKPFMIQYPKGAEILAHAIRMSGLIGGFRDAGADCLIIKIHPSERYISVAAGVRSEGGYFTSELIPQSKEQRLILRSAHEVLAERMNNEMNDKQKSNSFSATSKTLGYGNFAPITAIESLRPEWVVD